MAIGTGGSQLMLFTTSGISTGYSLTANSFSGAGTGLTGTASSLTAGAANSASGTLSSQVTKAWMNYNGTGYSIRASYNISSVTHNSGGNYTINFTNAFSDTNYAMVAICSLSYPNTGGFSETVMPGTTSTGSQVILTGVDHSGTQFQRDEPYICAAFFR